MLALPPFGPIAPSFLSSYNASALRGSHVSQIPHRLHPLDLLDSQGDSWVIGPLKVMNRRSRKSASSPAQAFCCLWMILMILLGGCITPEQSYQSPDLIAVPEGSFGGTDAFCDLTGVPQLRIVVLNQGQGDAAASITRVAFSPGGTVNIPTPPVRAAQRAILASVLIPAACFDPDCDFKIMVDSRSEVDEEAGEENNVVDGRCMRP